MKWKKRMFLLIEGPRLVYIDPDKRVVKGEMKWSVVDFVLLLHA